MSLVPKPKPYRRYLNSVLHSRFVYATLLALLNGLVISFWTGSDYFWSWFPLGFAGLKAAMFSMCSLAIFILQISSLTVGRRTSLSPYALLRKTIFEMSTLWTILAYTVSAWWFCQVFILAVPASKQLGWVIKGDMSSPDRLNERPMYLRWFFTVLGLVQAGLHLYSSQSAMHIPVTKPPTPQSNDPRTHIIDPITIQARKKAPYMLKNALICSGVASIIAPITYKGFVRNTFWQIHLTIAKLFSNISRSDAHPPDTYFIGTIILSAFAFGVLLSLTWESSTYSLLAYLKEEPIKNGFPISAASQDPNGTLLNGLNSKIDVVKTFAFWELTIIAQRYPDRRMAIFADFERPSGSMWSSMHQAALSVISSIDGRILGLSTSASPPAQQQQQQQIISLPRIVKNPNSDPVFAASPPPSYVAAKSLGQSKHPWRPPIEQTKEELVEYAKTTALQHKGIVMQWIDMIPSGLVRDFFHTSVSGKIASVALGSPVGNAAIIVDAIESITKMLIASLNEDNYGKVVQTVPDTVKQFTRTIQLIEQYIGSNAQNLTTNDQAQLQEVVIVVERLRISLQELLSAFQVFLSDTGLSIQDLNAAKKASEDGPVLPEVKQQKPEMRQVSNEAPRKEIESNGERKAPEDGRKERRAEERQPKRLESGSRKQQNGDGNVFGARDFNSEPGRRREKQQA